MWTCLVQVRHSEHQDDEDAEDVDDGHLLGIPHMYGAEVDRRRVGGCQHIWGEQNIHQFDNILFIYSELKSFANQLKTQKRVWVWWLNQLSSLNRNRIEISFNSRYLKQVFLYHILLSALLQPNIKH